MTSRPPTKHRWPGLLKTGGALLVPPVFLLVACWPVHYIDALWQQGRCRLPDRGFALQWQHSVEKEQWREHYVRQGQHLLLTRSQFKTYGAGTPSSGRLHSNDGLIDYQIDRRLEQLTWVVSANVQSALWLDNQALPVHGLIDDYHVLDFSVRRLPLWQFLRMDTCHDFFRHAGNTRSQ